MENELNFNKRLKLREFKNKQTKKKKKKRKEIAVEWETIVAKQITDKELMYKIIKTSHKSVTKRQSIQLKKWSKEEPASQERK